MPQGTLKQTGPSARGTTWPLPVLVEIEWNDSITTHNIWVELKDHPFQAVGPLKTVGYIVRSTRQVIEVAQSQSAVTQHFTDTMTIPRGAVRKVRRLK